MDGSRKLNEYFLLLPPVTMKMTTYRVGGKGHFNFTRKLNHAITELF